MNTSKELSDRIISNLKKEKTNQVFSIDWLTINVSITGVEITPVIHINSLYLQKRERGSNVFAHIYDIYNKQDDLISVICCKPNSTIMGERFAQLQISNKWLYVGNLNKLINEILFKSNLEFVSISRIDFCCDLYKFENDLTPKGFIEEFAKENVTKTYNSKFNLWGKTTGYTRDYHQLSIGDNKSVFTWKLYNKSKELRDVHDKAYIRRKWELKLLDYSIDKDVWRLEVSVKNWSKVQFEDKRLENVKNDWFSIINDYPAFFLAFLSKKFVFRNDLGDFIDFIRLPEDLDYYRSLSTTISVSEKLDDNYRDKVKIVTNHLNIIKNASNELEAKEYIDRLYDLIGDNVFYEIMLKQGITPNVLDSFYVDKYNKLHM
jgi:hypothetical protein